MGGDYPKGREWNFFQDARSAKYVIDNWPTRVVFVGYSLGLQVLTGQPLKGASESSPVKLAYMYHNEFAGRPSWDQLAVLYAGLDDRGRVQVFKISDSGINSISENGTNRWQQNKAGNHYFISLRQDRKVLTDTINEMMLNR